MSADTGPSQDTIDDLLEMESQIVEMAEAKLRAYAKKMLAILALCCKTNPSLKGDYERLAAAISSGGINNIKKAIGQINALIRAHLAKVREPTHLEIKTPTPWDD